jgi:hypothetical protein
MSTMWSEVPYPHSSTTAHIDTTWAAHLHGGRLGGDYTTDQYSPCEVSDYSSHKKKSKKVTVVNAYFLDR